MYPIFVVDSQNVKNEIKSLPEQYQFSVDQLEAFLTPLVAKGLRSIIIFGVLLEGQKDPEAKCALSSNSPVIRAIKLIKSLFPELYIATDVCLCGVSWIK